MALRSLIRLSQRLTAVLQVALGPFGQWLEGGREPQSSRRGDSGQVAELDELGARSDSRSSKRYAVYYDERVQGRYASKAEALLVAESASSMQRFTFVTEGRLRNSLVAVFPRGYEKAGREAWNTPSMMGGSVS